jgi:hypothetical protein
MWRAMEPSAPLSWPVEACLMVRGLKPAELPWPSALAQRIVVEINRRREWRRALHRGSN